VGFGDPVIILDIEFRDGVVGGGRLNEFYKDIGNLMQVLRIP
jgi:hypothetical protein